MQMSEWRRMVLAGALLISPLSSLLAAEPTTGAPTQIETVSPTANVKLRAGEFKLLKTNSRVVRLATSNPEVCSAVNFDGRTLGIWGRSGGTSDVTVWLADRSSSPVIWVVDVK